MLKDIQDKRDWVANRYTAVTRHTIQVEYVPFMYELAEQLGVKPDLGKNCQHITFPKLDFLFAFSSPLAL